MRWILLSTLLVLQYSLRAEADTFLVSEAARLTFSRQPSGRYGVCVSCGSKVGFDQRAPAGVLVRGVDRSQPTSAAAYATVTANATGIVALADVRTAHGSRFNFVDTWTPDRGGSFRLTRRVTVAAADPRDLGFDSCISLHCPNARSVRDCDVFIPGVWYRQNEHVVANAIGANSSLGSYLVKETRMALPLVSIRPRDGGSSLTFLHLDAHPSTALNDTDAGEQTDASIQYASLGPCVDPDGVSLQCRYPGSEGERSYGVEGWRYRWHPVREGFAHEYRLLVRGSASSGDFPVAMSDAWRFAYGILSPDVHPAPSSALYREGLQTFDEYFRDDFRNGGRGVPFMIFLGLHPPLKRDRRVAPAALRGPSDYHLQSGFVGEQTGAAYLMFRQAMLVHHSAEKQRWASVLDFWVNQSLSPAGVPRTDYFCEAGKWGEGPSFLRTLSDGTESVLDAYHFAARYGERRGNWLAYARHVGDWLLSEQAADGSWSRSYQLNGSVAHAGKFNTTNPLRFLVKLSLVTGDGRYLAAAGRAGKWCLDHIDAPAAYVGGTTDNDNTIDKEAGVLAFYGFQSLYGATGDARWLAAAARAADYAETWTFVWSYTVAPAPGAIAPTRSPWPECGLVGQSLVATGHSYADMFMAGCSTAYYRLSLQTRDDHYKQFARLLADGANRPADVDRRLHYPHAGLIDEGINPADFVAAGPGNCLTWCTVAQVRPVADLQDRFGYDRIEEIEGRLPPAERLKRNKNDYPNASSNGQMTTVPGADR